MGEMEPNHVVMLNSKKGTDKANRNVQSIGPSEAFFYLIVSSLVCFHTNTPSSIGPVPSNLAHFDPTRLP